MIIKFLFKKDSFLGVRTLFFLIFSVFLIVTDLRVPPFHRVCQQISVAFLPIRYVVNLPGYILNKALTDMMFKQELLQQNAQLQASLVLLKAQLQQQYALESENQQLRNLLNLNTKNQLGVQAAQLISEIISPFVREIILNKGSMDHVFEGQAVADEWGIMGQVIEVNALSSQVMLIIDSRSSVPVQNQRNHSRAIAIGDPQLGMLRLEHILNTEDIQEGDIFITSGLGGRYPYGYPVGQVISVIRNAGSQFSDIIIKPSAHLTRSRIVLLLQKS